MNRFLLPQYGYGWFFKNEIMDAPSSFSADVEWAGSEKDREAKFFGKINNDEEGLGNLSILGALRNFGVYDVFLRKYPFEHEDANLLDKKIPDDVFIIGHCKISESSV